MYSHDFFQKAPRPWMKDHQKREVTQQKGTTIAWQFLKTHNASTHIPGFWNNMLYIYIYIFLKLLTNSATFAETKWPYKQSKVHQQANNDHGIMQRNTTIKLHQAGFLYLRCTSKMIGCYSDGMSIYFFCCLPGCYHHPMPRKYHKKNTCLGVTRVWLNLQNSAHNISPVYTQ